MGKRVDWNNLVRKDRGTLLLIGYTACLSAIALIYIWFSQPKPKSIDDLIIIPGQLREINLIDRNRYYDYTLKLFGYSNAFKVKADFIGYFNIDEFKKLGLVDSITLGIAKEDAHKLNYANDEIFLFLIKNSNTVFLDSKDTIAFQNSNTYLYISAPFFLGGFLAIYFGYKSKIKTKVFGIL